MEIIEYRLGERYFDSCVIALGFFDGVHLGHRDLLMKAREAAARLKVPFGVFTFRSSGNIKAGAKRIYTDTEKCEILAELSADFTVLAEFSELSGISAEEFVSRVLIDSFGARIAVAGFNYRFGKGASGDASALSVLMKAVGSEALICEEFKLDGKTVSTTLIREALALGDIKKAERLLGAPYKIKGVVARGRGEGTRLGFPTLNTHPTPEILLPKKGVYHTEARIGSTLYTALTNVGTCPTFDERELHLETYLLDFSGNLYDEEISIYFIDYLREEKRFSSEKELIMQINVDKNKILNKT